MKNVSRRMRIGKYWEYMSTGTHTCKYALMINIRMLEGGGWWHYCNKKAGCDLTLAKIIVSIPVCSKLLKGAPWHNYWTRRTFQASSKQHYSCKVESRSRNDEEYPLIILN